MLLFFALSACSTDDQSASSALFEPELAQSGDRAVSYVLESGGRAEAAGVEAIRTLSVKRDGVGAIHTKVQQLAGNVPVWQGEAIVHDDGTGLSLTDAFVPNVQIDATPAFTADDAIEVAIPAAGLDWTTLSLDPSAELWVFRHEGSDHLAWKVQLHSVLGGRADTTPVVFVDAHTAQPIWQYENLQTAACSGTTNYYGAVNLDCYTDGTSYYLEDTTDLLGTYTWGNTTSSLYYASSTTSAFSSTDPIYINAVEAQFVSSAVDDYYAVNHGRNGIDGAGGPAAITSHGYNFITSTTSYSSNYVNAFWDPTGLYMTYGDGDGSNATSLTTLDIAGHEMTHGVTQYEANLTYSGEPGHLNESMSDVFGAMVERSILGASSDVWLIGEEAWTPATTGDALRYMNDPQDDGVSYDYYSSSLSSVDVHYGSGVGNLAFYLLSEGGTHPRGKSTTVVTGIGADDAADIWYLALSSYMTSSTNYAAARTATLSAAAALFGSTSTQYTQVGNAWTAVGVAAAPSCTTSTYTGSLSKTGRSVYLPSSAGTSVTATSQTVTMTGPSSANFDVYLQLKSGRSWGNAASGSGSTSTESISYSGAAGTYRVYAVSKSGGGSYSISWCR